MPFKTNKVEKNKKLINLKEKTTTNNNKITTITTKKNLNNETNLLKNEVESENNSKK